jgi:hypothetical protein
MAGALTISTLNDDAGVLATQNGMTGIAKAWVNFNGTGTVAIRTSFNVSSITDNGTGDYTVNFTTAMPNADYCLVGASGRNTSPGPVPVSFQSSVNPTTSAARIECGFFSTNTRFDSATITVAFFSS